MTNDLTKGISDWLSKNGYPLEFETANIFKEVGFSTYQGQYISDINTGIAREIDVVAEDSCVKGSDLFRISYFIECKWTNDKPWVIFTDENSKIHPIACINQTLMTTEAKALVTKKVLDKRFTDLMMFRTPLRPGFNGVQAHLDPEKNNKGQDLVYSTLKSITSACYSALQQFTKHKKLQPIQNNYIIFFPIIVINGKLFEAYYDKEMKGLNISEKSFTRLHWRGSDNWKKHFTIDIVTKENLPLYAKELITDTKTLLNLLLER